MCDTGVIHKSGIYHTFYLLIINAYKIKCDRVTENPEKQHKKRHPFLGAGQSCLVPAPRAGTQKDRPYQSVFIWAVLIRSRAGLGNRTVYQPACTVILDPKVTEFISYYSVEYRIFGRNLNKIFFARNAAFRTIGTSL